MSKITPKLIFPVSTFSGFTSASTTSLGTKGFVVVRELIQNSLDASREANRDITRVRFEVKTKATEDIPEIERYKKALKKAIDGQKKINGKLPDQANMVVSLMQKSLKEKKSKTLYVLDNGIGLDKNNIKGLIGEGYSTKKQGNTGSFGVGHLAIIPFSNLQYILYGGFRKNGRKDNYIASGHAVLASHPGEDGAHLGKDGYLLNEYKNSFENPFEFPTNNEVPKYIKESLEWIKSNWRTSGTAIIVPGFDPNKFKKEDNSSVWDMIEAAAACNFFAAISSGELVIEYLSEEEGLKPKTLNKKNIDAVMNKLSENKRSTHKGFLSGENAYRAYKAFVERKKLSISTEIGTINIKIRKLDDGSRSRIDLFRNGMWITDDIPKLNRDSFTRLEPFNCLILIKSDNGKIHELIRKMEGVLHNDLGYKKLDKEEKEKYRSAMEKIAKEIKKAIPESKNETFRITDTFTVKLNTTSEIDKRSIRSASFTEMSPFVRKESHHRSIDPGDDPDTEIETDKDTQHNKKPKHSKANFDRSGNGITFNALPIPTGNRSCRIHLTPDEKCQESELRFSIDDGLDESCDDLSPKNYVKLENIKVNDELVPRSRLLKNEANDTLGVLLGKTLPDQKIIIETDYVIPDELNLPKDIPVVLKTEVIRRANQNQN